MLLRGAGTGGLGLAIEGPSEAKMSCKDNKDGSCSVEYIPFTPGEYDVNITFGGLPIPGSPSSPSCFWRPGLSGFGWSGSVWILQIPDQFNRVSVLQGVHSGFQLESWWIQVKSGVQVLAWAVEFEPTSLRPSRWTAAGLGWPP